MPFSLDSGYLLSATYLKEPIALKKLADILHVEKLENLELLAREIVEGFIMGLHRSPYHGFSVEFAEHRQYNKGESTKHVDWKLFARSGKLFVKQFEEETNLRAHIVVDTSSSMLFSGSGKSASKLTFSLLCAASLIHLLRRQRDAVGLCTFSKEIDILTPAKLSMVHAQYLYASLEKLLQPQSVGLNRETKIAAPLHQLAEGLHKRSFIIIFSDLMGSESPKEIFESLQHLRYNKHEVLLFVVRDYDLEGNLKFDGRPTRFVDMETGESLKLNPVAIRDQYQMQQDKFLKELRLNCGQFAIDLVEADINKEFGDVLLSYLLKRGKLY